MRADSATPASQDLAVIEETRPYFRSKGIKRPPVDHLWTPPSSTQRSTIYNITTHTKPEIQLPYHRHNSPKMHISTPLLTITTLLSALTVHATPAPGTYQSLNARTLLVERQFGCDCGESSCSPSSPPCCANGSCSCVSCTCIRVCAGRVADIDGDRIVVSRVVARIARLAVRMGAARWREMVGVVSGCRSRGRFHGSLRAGELEEAVS